LANSCAIYFIQVFCALKNQRARVNLRFIVRVSAEDGPVECGRKSVDWVGHRHDLPWAREILAPLTCLGAGG
jgi:hypothetical protein